MFLIYLVGRVPGAMGDFLVKSHEKGGLDFGTIGSSEILRTILVAFVIYTTLKAKKTRFA